jgi:hypothetical protein
MLLKHVGSTPFRSPPAAMCAPLSTSQSSAVRKPADIGTAGLIWKRIGRMISAPLGWTAMLVGSLRAIVRAKAETQKLGQRHVVATRYPYERTWSVATYLSPRTLYCTAAIDALRSREHHNLAGAHVIPRMC